MKSVLSISLGSPTRDHETVLELGNHKVKMQRMGVNGDAKKMIELYGEYDGKVDAFGAGGFLLNFHVADRYYPLRSARKLIKNIHQTPIVDGNGVKDTIEKNIMQTISEEEFSEVRKELDNNICLMTSAVDRYGMASSINKAGFDLVIGDFMFALGIKIKLHSLKSVRRISRVMMPIMGFFPLSWLYPLGEKQERHNSKYEKQFEKPSIIAGDYLFIKQYMPKNLENKVIVTNTTTASDRDELEDRGVRAIITSTPRLAGRSFGTNVLEAALVAISEKKRSLTSEEMEATVKEFNLGGNLDIL